MGRMLVIARELIVINMSSAVILGNVSAVVGEC